MASKNFLHSNRPKRFRNKPRPRRRCQNLIQPRLSFICRLIPSCDQRNAKREHFVKRLILILLVGPGWLPQGFARDNSLLARVTVYWAGGGHGADHYTRQHKSATGLRLR